MSQAKKDESGVRARVEPLSPTAIGDKCHAIIDAVSALLANVEFLQDRSSGSEVGREAIAADAHASIKRIVEIARTLQDHARTAARRAA